MQQVSFCPSQLLALPARNLVVRLTSMTELSPAAEAVLDAALPHMVHRYSVAAALRAVADQVVPMALCLHNDDFVYVRHQLHAIADELEGAGAGCIAGSCIYG